MIVISYTPASCVANARGEVIVITWGTSLEQKCCWRAKLYNVSNSVSGLVVPEENRAFDLDIPFGDRQERAGYGTNPIEGGTNSIWGWVCIYL